MEKQTSRAGGFWLWTLCWKAPLPQPPLSLMEGGGVSVSLDKSASPGTYCLQGGGAGSTWHCQGDTAWKRWETCPRPPALLLGWAGSSGPRGALLGCVWGLRPSCLSAVPRFHGCWDSLSSFFHLSEFFWGCLLFPGFIAVSREDQ